MKLSLAARIRVAVAVASILAPLSASGKAPTGWRDLTPEEERLRVADTAPDSIDPAAIEADFDGDGAKDRAAILVRLADGARGVVVALKNRVVVLAFSGSDRSGIDPDAEDLTLATGGLGVAKPGLWAPNCFDDDCKAARRSVRLKSTGLIVIDETITLLYYWNPKTGRFARMLMVH